MSETETHIIQAAQLLVALLAIACAGVAVAILRGVRRDINKISQQGSHTKNLDPIPEHALVRVLPHPTYGNYWRAGQQGTVAHVFPHNMYGVEFPIRGEDRSYAILARCQLQPLWVPDDTPYGKWV